MDQHDNRRRERSVLLAGAGILCALLVGVVVAKLPSGHDEATSEDTPSGFMPSEAVTEPPLPQLFQDAENCLKLCKGLGASASSKLPLPYKFANLIRNARFNSAYQKLIAGFPPGYVGLARLSAGDPRELDFNGSTDAVLTVAEGRRIQIYDNVGYVERHGDTADSAQRPAGILHVAVDLATGEMAGIFNGPDTLSDYRFSGDPSLYGALLAFQVADNNYMMKLQQMGFPENAPQIAFPLAGTDLTVVSDRLRYLASHFADGEITGTQSLDEIQEAADDREGRNWYTYNSSRTACNKVGGPAEKLKDFVGYADRPTTNDFRDASGNVTKVEVVNPGTDGTEEVWTFYRHRAECEQDWGTRNQDLVDRYQ